MLIKALCDYYDILAADGKVLPAGYSNVKVHYLVCLTKDGKIDEITDWQRKEIQNLKGGKTKEKIVPRIVTMPERTEKTGIDANIVEHRSAYLFGLIYADEKLTHEDRTGKAKKSHDACVTANLKFIEGINTPVVDAYRSFLLNWAPDLEEENQQLIGLGKKYSSAGFVFCLSGEPDKPLHEDLQLKEKWDREYKCKSENVEGGYVSQCAVTGETAKIARIHKKIRGVNGGLAMGNVLIGFKDSFGQSYGNEQSYNSNISEIAMEKYTEALNYLLNGKAHKALLDDLTVVFWAMKTGEVYEDGFTAMLNGESDKFDAARTEDMLKELLTVAEKGKINIAEIESLDCIHDNVDFYMVGLKPNSSRLSIKFIYKRKYGDVLWNMARFQREMQISDEIKPIAFYRIKGELVSPKSTKDKVDPALLVKIFEAIMYGSKYPTALLENVVRRVKTDTDRNINRIRAGLIKACINRNYKREEIKVALDKENYGQAYLCGRLFAVLEKLQQSASNNSLNKTIKDSYFSSAVSKPAMVFPKLIMLAQNHLNKLEERSRIFYNKQIGEIVDNLNGEFPDTILLADQGRFIIGYYQQYQSFFRKNDDKEQ